MPHTPGDLLDNAGATPSPSLPPAGDLFPLPAPPGLPEVHVEPPYPGALQDELAWHLVKYLREDARLHTEVAVEVPATAERGPAYFTLDLAIDLPAEDGQTRRIAFEAAPARSVLRDHDRLLRRDANVLAVGGADVIYRLRGSDLLHRMADVLYLASKWDPSLFSERGRINLDTLAEPETKAATVRPEQPSVLVAYTLGDDPEHDAPERQLWHVANGMTPHILVRRLDRRLPAVWAPYTSDGYVPRPLRRV